MMDTRHDTTDRWVNPAILRAGLFLVAASLAFYIPYKYATQLHAISGLYAYVFPLSGFLAAAGMILAVKPQAGCDCSGSMRAGFGAFSVLWIAVGLLCVPSLVEMTRAHVWGGAFATFHMTMQHIVLSLAIIGFAVAPERMARLFGARPDSRPYVAPHGATAAG